MRLVFIDNYDSFTFNLLQILGEIAGERPIVFKNDEVGPAEIEALAPAGVVLSPGPGHPRDAGRLIEIVSRLDPRIPILGVCLGHQAIVESEGGTVKAAPSVMHGKTSEIFHSDGVLFRNVPNPCIAMRYHSLAAEPGSLPETLRVCAQTEDKVIMAVEHRTRPVLGVQFHPESIATGLGPRMLANFMGYCAANMGKGTRSLDLRDSGDVSSLLERILGGHHLSRDEARLLGAQIIDKTLSPAQVGAISTAIRAKGEHPEEVTGLAMAFSGTRATIPADAHSAINITGTGGHQQLTSNVLKAAALVMASADTAVTVNGWNTGQSIGSADLLETLGVRACPDNEGVTEALAQTGFSYICKPLQGQLDGCLPNVHHFGLRSIFRLAVPLVGGIGTNCHFIGVYSHEARGLVARSLKALGARQAAVVHGDDGLSCLTIADTSHVTLLGEDGRLVERRIDPRELGLKLSPRSSALGEDSTTDVRILMDALDGAKGAQTDLVALNAALGLWIAGKADSLADGLEQAMQAITSGATAQLIHQLTYTKDLQPECV